MSFGNLYKIPFTATLTTNPYDLIGVTAPNNSQVVLRASGSGFDLAAVGTQLTPVSPLFPSNYTWLRSRFVVQLPSLPPRPRSDDVQGCATRTSKLSCLTHWPTTGHRWSNTDSKLVGQSHSMSAACVRH